MNLPNNDPSGAVKSAIHVTFNQTSEKPENLNILGVRKWSDKSLRSSKVNRNLISEQILDDHECINFTVAKLP